MVYGGCKSVVKLRLLPEDFRVTETGGPTPATDEGWKEMEHRLYRLEKKGHDTISLLARLSRELSLPRRSFGLSGLKDRHAVTSQLVSLPRGRGKGLPTEIGQSIGDGGDFRDDGEIGEEADSEAQDGFREVGNEPDSEDFGGEADSEEFGGFSDGDGWRLTLLGGSAEKLRSGSHESNRFRIVVRDITREQIDRLPRRLEQANIHGWPNWFDTQRFGSEVAGELPGEYIVVGDYESAMKLTLTRRNKSDRSDRRRDKRVMAEKWPEVGDLKLEHRPHQKLIRAYNRATETGATAQELWRRVYMAMPYDIRGLWLSAWQSSEWNAHLSELLHEHLPSHLMREVEIGVGGPLYFPEVPSGKRGKPKRNLVERIEVILQNLPETLQLPHSDLNLSVIDQHLSGHHRPVMVRTPVTAEEEEVDEMRKRRGKRWKVTLDFELPPGAYATVLVKRLFH